MWASWRSPRTRATMPSCWTSRTSTGLWAGSWRGARRGWGFEPAEWTTLALGEPQLAEEALDMRSPQLGPVLQAVAAAARGDLEGDELATAASAVERVEIRPA